MSEPATTFTALRESVLSVIKLAAVLGSIVGCALFLFYCTQIRYWPATDIVALSGTFIAISALATAILLLLLAPAALTYCFVTHRSSSPGESPTTVWECAVMTVGQVTASFALLYWLLLDGWFNRIFFPVLALMAVLLGTPSVLRYLRERVGTVTNALTRHGQSEGLATRKHRIKVPIRRIAQHCGAFIRLRLAPLSAIALGGFFLFAALLLFKNSDVLYRPVRGSASTISINNVVFSLVLFLVIFACNLGILAIKKSANGKQVDIQMALALAATLYGAGIVFLCMFGFNGKFLAALGIGDLPDCTIIVRAEVADGLTQLGYRVVIQDAFHSATASGVHVLLISGSELVIGACPSMANPGAMKIGQPPIQTATIPRSLLISLLRPPNSM
jgi:hypothetical protein